MPLVQDRRLSFAQRHDRHPPTRPPTRPPTHPPTHPPSNAASDRFYRALYEALLAEGARAGSKAPQFLALLFKAMKQDPSPKRWAPFSGEGL